MAPVRKNYLDVAERMILDLYMLTATGLTSGGSSTVQYTFTQKQYTEQHNETEYTEQNVHNNKNTKFTTLKRRIHNIQPYIQ